MWSGSLVFWQRTCPPTSGIPSVSTSCLVKAVRLYLLYSISFAMFVRSVRLCHQAPPGRRPSTGQDQSALVSFLLVNFDQGLSAILYLVFSVPVTLPSHFSRVFAGGHFPALGYTVLIQVTAFVRARPWDSVCVCVKYAIHSSRIGDTWSCRLNHIRLHRKSTIPFSLLSWIRLSWSNNCNAVLSITSYATTVVALQSIMSEGLIWEVDLLITRYVKSKLKDSNFTSSSRTYKPKVINLWHFYKSNQVLQETIRLYSILKQRKPKKTSIIFDPHKSSTVTLHTVSE